MEVKLHPQPHTRILNIKIQCMNSNFLHRFVASPGALFLAIAPLVSLISTMTPVLAQTAIPSCQAPGAGEYVLLVVSPTAENQKQLRKALPSDIKTITCKYLQETVTRVGGFKKMDDANRWARYINNIVGLNAIITTRPASQAIAAQPATTQPVREQTPKPPTSRTITYNPKVLGEGYAVLVDYYNRPELALSVQKVVGGDVGLVAYGQRPYLLAVYTTNQREAYNTLQRLNENGFVALLADGRKVMLLRSVVRL